MSIVNANTGITLRTEKGSALTFNEMDQNFSSFFYSASIASSGGTNRLRLFYTGSTDLDNPGFTPDRYMEMLLPSSQGGTTTITETLSVPGITSNVLFSKDNALAAAGSFVFEEDTARVGIGVVNPDAPLTVSSMKKATASTVTIRANAEDSEKYSRGYFEIKRDGNPLMMLGKLGNGDNRPTRLYSKENIEIGITDFGESGGTISGNSVMKITNNGTILGNNIASSTPASRLSVIGEFSIGNSNTNTALNYIGVNTVGASYLPSPPQGCQANTQGLLIQSPKAVTGGHVTIGINAGSSQCESFTIASGCEGTFDSAIATFKADGDVGIGQRNPQAKLHVEGNISGSGNIKIEGSATIDNITELHAISTSKANFESTTNDLYKSVVIQEGNNTLAYLNASPVPKGGIIMWGGRADNIPFGWALCDGRKQNGITTPNLTDRFIVAGKSDGDGNGRFTGSDILEGISTINPLTSGGSKQHTHNTNTEGHCLTIGEMPSHQHRYVDAYYAENTGTSGGVYGSKGCQDNDNEFAYRTAAGGNTHGTEPSEDNNPLTFSAGSGDSHKHCVKIPLTTHVPPFYALAFIMYVGGF